MKRLWRIGLLGALLIGLLAGEAWAPPPTVVIEPGKDSQVYRPETPGYIIKQNQDRVERYRGVPAPPEPGAQEKKKSGEAKGKESEKK